MSSTRDVRRLLVVIVNYRTADLIIGHYPALAAELAGRDASVVIVDNASPGDDAIRLKDFASTTSGAVRVIEHSRNDGFGAGNNIAIRSALFDVPPPDLFWLLNPDAYPKPGALAAMLECLDATADVGIVGSALEDEHGVVQTAAFKFFSIASEFASQAELGIVDALLRPWIIRINPQQSGIVDWVSGASCLVRRQVFEQAGLFDERYFLYFEETDLMRAARRGGWRTAYTPAGRIVHYCGKSTQAATGSLSQRVSPAFWYESRKLYFRKNHGPVYAFLADVAHLAGLLVRLLRQATFPREGANERVVPQLKRFLQSQFGGAAVR